MATFAERITQLQGGANIIGVRTKSDPARVSGWDNLWTAQLEYVTQSNGVATQNAVALVGVDADNDGTAEAWYWARHLPEPLRPTANDDRYFTGRTTPFTAAQIESYCQAKWTALNPTSGPILQFNVSAVDSRSVQVTGLFDVSGSRERRTYLIWLVDVNGSVTPNSSNVKFELVKEATAI